MLILRYHSFNFARASIHAMIHKETAGELHCFHRFLINCTYDVVVSVIAVVESSSLLIKLASIIVKGP